MDNLETVEAIINAIRRGDADHYVARFAEDAVLEHPLEPEPVRGREAIRENEDALFESFSDIEVEVRSMTSGGPRVVAEVVLRATSTSSADPRGAPAGRSRIEIPAVWIFEFGPDGLVTAERDYFDTAALTGFLP
ncbi:MAG TPA: nuclear transport factor 2 family protein [Actinomycetota bacterium]|nr:nuclear transport factor 2 family protein [Actinomycetota bacterium]